MIIAEMSMKELVNKLAALQAEKEAIEEQIDCDRLIQENAAIIAELEEQVADRRVDLQNLVAAYGQAAIDEQIDEVKAGILAEWDRDQKTIKCDTGTLTFRTTYGRRFNKETVKEYIGVINLPMSDAEIVSNTSVKLDRIEKEVD